MRRARLKPISDRTRRELAEWRRVTQARMADLKAVRGYAFCEYCRGTGKPFGQGPYGLHGHHIDRNRRNNTYPNCYLAHNACQEIIHTRHLQVQQTPILSPKPS